MTKHDRNRTHFVACNLCEAICGLEIAVRDGAVRSIRGDQQDPVSRGHICPKAVALQDVYNDPDRLRTPLKKNASGWETIPWRQAFDEAAEGLKSVQRRHGRNAVAAYLGNPTVHNLDAMLFAPMFFRTLKTDNRYSATSVDQLPEQLASLLMFGHALLIPLPDLDRTGFHLVFGANPVVSNGSLMTAPGVTRRLKGIGERGGRLVVVDPRRSETAAIADEHLFIRPGTDALMLLSMLQVVFDEGLQTLGKADAYVRGMGTIESLARRYPPENTAGATGVAPGTLRALVRGFCAAPSASCYGRIGVSTQAHGTLAQWLINVFNIVTGNLDRPGGTMFTKPAIDILSPLPPGRTGFGDKRTRVRGLPNFSGEFPVAALAEEITTPGDGQVRALVTSSGNPVLSTPNGSQLDEALRGLDFMVSIDFYLNETTRHADLILPPPMALERSHYDLAFQALAIRNAARYSLPVFPVGAAQRSDARIYLELAWRMQNGGLPARLAGWLKKEALARLGNAWIVNRQLKRGPYGKRQGLDLKTLKKHPHGLDLGPLEPCLPDRLFTADKTIDLAPDALVSEAARLESLVTSAESAANADGFDLRLIGRRDPRTNNSWLHNSYRLVKGKPRCHVLVHPSDAEARGVRDGEEASVTSRVGSVVLPVRLSEEVMPGVISIPHGWGHGMEGVRLRVAREHAGVNVNILTDDRFLDGVSGNAALNGVPVSLSAVRHNP